MKTRKQELIATECTKALWARVLVRAIFDYVAYKDSIRNWQKLDSEMAARWIFDTSHLLNGFENICKFIGLNPDDVRVSILKMHREDDEFMGLWRNW